MARILRTDPFPTNGRPTPGQKLITLHPAAAAEARVPHISLRHLAVDCLRAAGLTPAPRLVARHLIKKAVGSVMANVDVAAEATRIRAILEIVLRTGVDQLRLIEYGSSRVQNLGRIAVAYREQLRTIGLVDSAEVFCEAAEAVAQKHKLFIHGYFRARKEEVRFIDAIADEGSEYLLPVAEDSIFAVNRRWGAWLESQGWTTLSEVSEPQNCGERVAMSFATGAPIDDCSALAYPNIDEECRDTLGTVKQILSAGTAPSRIAIVCREQEEYVPILTAVADEYQVPLRIRHEVDIGRTAIGGFIRVMLEAVDSSMSFEAGARLLKHRFGPKISADAWKQARVRRVSGFDDWAKLGARVDKLKWPERNTLEKWMVVVRMVLDELSVRQAVRDDARELTAYDTLFDGLKAAAKLDAGRELSREEFAATLYEILAEETVEFRPEHGGVGVYEPDTLLGATFDHVLVMGLSEGVFPAAVTEDPVVDFYERRQLSENGIEFADAAEIARWEALSFHFTVASARERLVLSHATSVRNRESLPSSFFDRLGIKPTDARPAGISSDAERRRVYLRAANAFADDAVIESARRQYAVESRRELSNTYDEFDGRTGLGIDPTKRGWSVSQITMIGQCGFKWWSSRVLGLSEVDEAELGMDYAKRGSFYHRVLELAVERARNADDIRAATLENIDQVFIDTEKDSEIALPMLANWDLQRSEHIRAIKRAVRAADFITRDAKVVALEAEFNLEWEGFALKGFIDRIDDTPDGLIAIDYKTSGSVPAGVKGEKGKLKIDVQIPIYSKVALPHLFPDGNLGTSHYYSLTKGTILRREQPTDLENLRTALAHIRGDLGAGNFAVDPDKEWDACKYCEFDTVCRKGPRLERKAAE